MRTDLEKQRDALKALGEQLGGAASMKDISPITAPTA